MGTGKRRYKGFWKGVFVCLLIVITYPLWLPLPAKFLLVKDNIKKADALVILSGDWNYDREAKAIELFKQGYADKIIKILEKENRGFNSIKQLLNSDSTQKEAYIRYFESRGIPGNSVILADADITSTFDELTAATGVVLRNKLKSIILITSDYHMRRTLMAARWVFRSQDIEIYNVTAHSKIFNPNKWWGYEEGIRSIVFEYLIIPFYLVYHFMLGK